jgi:hypothetical protein
VSLCRFKHRVAGVLSWWWTLSLDTVKHCFQVKARPTRWNSYDFIGNQLFLCVELLHTLHTACHPTLQRHNSCNRTENHRQWNTVWPLDDGCKDARNMLNNWLPIKSLIFASSWSRLFLLIKDARSFEHKDCFQVCTSPFLKSLFPYLFVWKQEDWELE